MAIVKKIPMRMCVGCGELKPKKEMFRILKSEEGYILDTTGKKNGRGAYVCPKQECMKRCVESHGLERSFKEKIPAQVYETLQQAFQELD